MPRPTRRARSSIAELSANGVEVLYNDLEERPGAKFAAADLIGIPWQILVGPKGLAEGKVELKCRADGSRQLLAPAEAVERLRDERTAQVATNRTASARNLCATA